jgi:pilus assembly protein TadC
VIWIALMCGIAVAAGFWLLVGSVRRPPPSLVLPVNARGSGVSVATLRNMELTAPDAGARFTTLGGIRVDSAGSPVGRKRSIRAAVVGDGSNWSTYRDVAGDLRVVDYTLDYVIYQQVLSALAGFTFPLVLFLLILPLGGLSAPLMVVLLIALALGAGGFYLPLHNLRQDAASRRREFAAALSHYVSFVDVLVSGGNSIDSSFEFAADLGRGWVWDELRFAIASASSATLAPYRALRDLGDELGVVELTNLARRLEQTQSTGAAIGPALRSLADSLAKDQARQVKVADDEVTEKMTFPLMVVLCSLLTFFGIAAVTAILRAAQGF